MLGINGLEVAMVTHVAPIATWYILKLDGSRNYVTIWIQTAVSESLIGTLLYE